MLVSEYVADQEGLADRQPGRSTFPGTPRAGGWIPVMAQSSAGERPFRIDWICPRCLCLTANYDSCPKCGLHVMESPTIKEPLSEERRRASYRRWVNRLQKEEDDASARRNSSEAQVEHQAAHKRRASGST